MNKDIAIIGLYARFPGADTYAKFWENLSSGACSISEIPMNRWDWRAIFGDPTEKNNLTNVKYAGFIDDIDKFDAGLFQISPREAELMDPRQRLLLTGAWRLFEDAGYEPSSMSGTNTGVYLGMTGDEYDQHVVSELESIDPYALTGVAPTLLANRLSFFFNLLGDSQVIDTACSSSLVAVNNAVQALQTGNVDQAIAGGINLIIDPEPHVRLSKIGMLAEDGRCKTFDKNADGYVRGEGLGLVLLKPLDVAMQDGDRIMCVIKASSVNHGGRANSLTAPNPKAQTQLLLDVYRKAGIKIDKLAAIEAHGTGTALGDPIETDALCDAVQQLASEQDVELVHGGIALSSVKANIGHLEAAAGISGLIKLVLCLQNKQVTPCVNLETVNPYINIDESPFYFPSELTSFQPDQTLVGVSSFGFGGANAHVVLELYEQLNADEKREPTPALQFNEKSYWVKPTQLHPLLHKKLNKYQFSSKFGLDNIWLEQHIVQGQAVLPGVSYIEIISQVAKQMGFTNQDVTISGLVWLRTLLGNDGVTQSVIIDIQEKNNKCYDCVVHHADDESMIFCFASFFVDKSKKKRKIFDLKKLQSSKAASASECYQQLAELGFDHGELFHAISELHTSEHGALASVAHTQSKQEYQLYYANPAILDAALQSAILLENNTKLTKEAKLPYAVDSICFYESTNNAAYVYVEPVQKKSTQRIQKQNIYILDEAGNCLVDMQGVSGRPLPKASVNTVNYYVESWQALDASSINTETKDIDHLLIVDANSLYGQVFADRLITQLNKLTYINEFSLDNNGVLDFDKLFAQLKSSNELPSHIVVFLPTVQKTDALFEPIDFIYHLQKQAYPYLARYGANILSVSVMPDDIDINHAIHRGIDSFALSLSLENNKLNNKHLVLGHDECESFIKQANLNLLQKVFVSNREHNSFYYRNKELCYRVLTDHIKPKLSYQQENFHDEGVYLITGANGGIAPKIARHIASKVKAKIILTGRQPISESIDVLLTELHTLGSRTGYIQTDLLDRNQVELMIDLIAAEYGELSGIVHCAGSLNDSLLINKGYQKFRDVIAPKVIGTSNLDYATREQPLDFIVLFSSLVAYTGNVGQTDYSYANKFMNEFAYVRENLRMHGLRKGMTKAIAWPLWDNGGMQVKSHEKAYLQEHYGMQAMSDKQALQIFDDAIGSDEINCIVCYGNKEKINKNLIKVA